jgi:hypothetical protein
MVQNLPVQSTFLGKWIKRRGLTFNNKKGLASKVKKRPPSQNSIEVNVKECIYMGMRENRWERTLKQGSLTEGEDSVQLTSL